MNLFTENTIKPLFIAEIGGNHEGDFEYAEKLTDLAIESGAEAIKFQLYTGETLVSSVESPQRHQHFKKFELKPEQHIALAKKVRNAGKLYSASVWDVEVLDWIDPYISFYKIGSGDLTAYPVIEAILKKRKPLVISTGLSEEQEVLDCLTFIKTKDDFYRKRENLIVLQCTSMYPITNADAHLNVMKTFQNTYNILSGYSDHTEGTLALETAAAMGAEVLEFHFTDTRKEKTFRDHKVSLTSSEVQALRTKINQIKQLQGSSIKKPLPIEIENEHHISFRRAVYPSKDIKKGDKFTAKNLTVLRPLVGIDAREFYQVIGKTANRDLKKHEKLDWSYIQ